MSKKDDLLRSMKDGCPWDKLDKSSKSTFYEAYQDWLQETRSIYNSVSMEITEVKGTRDQLNVANQQLISKSKTLEIDNAKETERNERLRADNATLTQRNEHVTKSLNDAQRKLNDLAGKGISEALLTEISSSDVQSHGEFLERIKTRKEHTILISENDNLRTTNIKYKEEIINSDKVLEEKQRIVASESNRADELKRQNRTFLDIVELVTLFTSHGYSIPLLKQLLASLRRFEIESKPEISIKRLLDALEKTKTILSLDELIATKTSEYATLKRLVAEVKGVYEGYLSTATSTLNKISAQVIECLEVQNQKVKQVSENALSQMKSTLEVGTIQTNSARTNVVKTFEHDLNSFLSSMLTIQLSIENMLKLLQTTIQEYGSTLRASGRKEHLLQQATALLAFQKDPNYIAQTPPELLLNLVRSIDIYAKTKLSTVDTKPSQRVYERERLGLSNTFSVKLTSLTSWLVEEFSRRFVEGTL